MLRLLKIGFLIPSMVIGLLLSTATSIYAEPTNAVYAYQASSGTGTYKAASLADIEKVVRNAMEERKNTVIIKYKGTTLNLLDTISSFIAKAIEGNEYLNYSYRSVHMSYKAYGTDVTITLQFKYYESAKEVKYVDEKIQSILAQIIKPTMNDHEKVKAVHDYLVLNLEYDTRLINNSPYPALKDGVTACNGYAMLVYKMLTKLGIEVRLISGVASSSAFSIQNHAWNMVKLDGNWYHLDATWDDPVPDVSGRVLYDYYLLTDQEIAKNHTWKTGGINGEEKPYPIASTPYFAVLQKKINTTNEAERYLNLLNSVDLHYLLPQYTANNVTQLREMIAHRFAEYNNEFTIRVIDSKGDLNTNLRQIIYDVATEKMVKSWSFASVEYVRGDSPNDYIITISDIIYHNSPVQKPVQTKALYPTPGHKSLGSYVNVNRNKQWTIQFDDEIRQSSISNENIYVVNSQGEKLNTVDISLKDEKNVTIKNKASYHSGETYYIYVNESVESANGEPLTEAVSIKFTIAQ